MQQQTVNRQFDGVRSHQEIELQQKRREVVNQSNRLLSGSAYLGGLSSGLDLLNRLRSDPYKAKSPETNLDVEQIARHASQAVVLSLLFSFLAVMVSILYMFSEGLLAWFFGLVGGGLIAYEMIYLRWANARRFLKPHYDPNYRIDVISGLTDLLKQRTLKMDPSQNVVTFGGYEPFLGSGGQISGWTLSIDRKPTNGSGKDTQRVPVPVHEWYQAVEKAIDRLQLPQLQKASLLFVKGSELEVDGEILVKAEARPVTHLSHNRVWNIGQGDLTGGKRLYRMYRYVDVARDMVFSYFLRFQNVGSITFIEGSVHTLPSVDHSRFSLTPVLKDGQVMRIVKTVVVAFILSWFYLFALVALWNIGQFALNIWSWRSYDSQQRRTIQKQEEYNYGRGQTFRESIAAPFYEDYYGIQDFVMYWKAIEEAIFEGVFELLKQKGIDTSKFEDATTTIVNSGIMVSGGKFTANQVTAGTGATSIMGEQKVQPTGFQGVAQAVRSTVAQRPQS